MELSDFVTAQTLNNNQLKAIRDKIVLEKLILRKAVLALYPYFNVNDPANMQELEANLASSFPETQPALKAVRLNVQVKDRAVQLADLIAQNDPNGVLSIEVDWKKVPTNLANLNDFKTKATEILNFVIETERLKRVKSNNENSI